MDIPLNHSHVILDMDKYLKENRLKRNKISNGKNLLPLFKDKESNKSLNVSMKSISTINPNNNKSLSTIKLSNDSMNNTLRKIKIKIKEKSKEHSKGSKKSQGSKHHSRNSSKNSQKSKRSKKKIPFNSRVLRDTAKSFILNDNPGIGHYKPNHERLGNFSFYFFKF